MQLHTAAGIGQQREAGRKATYTLELKEADGSTHSCDVDEPIWRKYADGATVVTKVRRMTGGVSCGSIE